MVGNLEIETLTTLNIMKKLLLIAIIGFAARLDSQTQAYLDINNVKALILNRNDMFWDPASGTARYEVPKGSGKHCNFAGSVWIGGFDAGGQLHASAMTYRQAGFDVWPGPLDTIAGNVTASVTTAFDKVWKLDYTQINAFLNSSPPFTPAADITSWPGNGNVSQGYAQSLAPYVDINSDGVYNSSSGDYPKIKGDQMVYYVVNDKYSSHGETGAPPLGIEMQVSAYAYGCPSVLAAYPVLANTTFYHYRIINRSSFQYNNAVISIWCDADLGQFNNDYIGCDTMNKIGYMYNATSNDPSGSGINGYGNYPPILSYQVLKGPYSDPNDGIDNDKDGMIDEPFEETKFNNFMYYNNNLGAFPPQTTNPSIPIQYYNYMTSYWKDGAKLKADSAGYIYSNTVSPTNYAYPGNPQTNAGWTESLRNNLPGDRRFLITNGPFTFKAGAVVDFEFSILTTFDSTAGGYKNLSKVVTENNNIAAFYALANKPSCVSIPTGIKQLSPEKINLQVVPNPATDFVKIISDQNIIGSEVRLYNSLGQIVFSDKAETLAYQINLKELSSGIYFVEVKGKDFKGTAKVIKQ